MFLYSKNSILSLSHREKELANEILKSIVLNLEDIKSSYEDYLKNPTKVFKKRMQY